MKFTGTGMCLAVMSALVFSQGAFANMLICTKKAEGASGGQMELVVASDEKGCYHVIVGGVDAGGDIQHQIVSAHLACKSMISNPFIINCASADPAFAMKTRQVVEQDKFSMPRTFLEFEFISQATQGQPKIERFLMKDCGFETGVNHGE